MGDLLLRVYHGLPGPLRTAAATARGLVLRRWRFGPETERLVSEALEREQWSVEKWRVWREQRLELVLRRAALEVPYYRELWASRRRQGDRASWSYLENWPILEKEAVRANPLAFVADDRDPRRMLRIHTSGTTAKPVSVYQTRDVVRSWYALTEARTRRWYGVMSNRDRWAVIGGQLVTPASQRKPPFWVWNAALGQLYLSSYHLAPNLIPYYVEALQRYRIRYIEGYTSSLHALSLGAIAHRSSLQMAVSLSYAEPLAEYQRRTIEAGLGGPVRETYGMAEAVTAASECEAGSLHLWPEVGWLEAVADGRPARTGETGDFVCTGMNNIDMPLVRYRLGDRGALGAETGCHCGRTLPILDRIEGRIDDVLYTVDGRSIGRLDPVFKADLPIHEAQIVQEALDRIRVRYVPAPGWDHEAGRSIVERLRDRMGPVEVVLEAVTEVPRSANGKFSAVVSMIKPPAAVPVVEGSSSGRGDSDARR